jgi:hypothetical protein
VQIFRELSRGDAGRATLGALGEPTARLLAPLVAEAAGAGGGDVATPSDPAEARFRLFDAAVALLRAAAERAPLALVIDDLHAADPSSLALLHFLGRNLRGLRALVIGAYRAEEARLAPDVDRILANIAREGTYLPLGPLGRADLATLVSSATGAAADAALVDAVERASEGNPLFVHELLRLLAVRGDLGPGRRPGAAIPVPDTVRDVIARRIARLDEQTRAALALASVIGRDFATSVAAPLTGHAPAALERHLAEAERAGLLQAPSDGAWRFSHVLVREALYRDMDPDRRAQAHRAVAEILERSSAAEEAVAEIAHHRLAALPLGDAGAAAESARRAAARAMARLAFEDAAALLEKTREALEALAAPPDARLACELTLLAGLARMRAGDVDRGRAACLAAAVEARRLGAGDLLTRAALGYGAEVMVAVTDPKLVGLLEEALEALPPGPSGLRAQCLARLAAALQPSEEPAGPIAMAREAVAMARALGDPDVLRPVLAAAGSAFADYARPDERAAVSDELGRLATAAGDRVLALRAQGRLVIDYLEMGSLERSARALDAYEALAHEFRQPRHVWPGRLMRAMLATAAGRFDEAERLADEVPATTSDETLRVTLAWRRVGHALACEREAAMMAAERALPDLFELPSFGSYAEDIVNMSLASLRARAGDLQAARRHLSAVPRTGHFYRHEYCVMAWCAEAIVLTENEELAALVYERLAPVAGCVASSGRLGMSCGGPIDGARGMLAAFLGRDAEAEAHFDAALALAAATGLTPHLAQLQHYAARFLARRGSPGDRARAEALAAASAALADELGLRLLRDRLSRGLAEGAAPARAATPRREDEAPAAVPASGPGPAFTLRREGDYWTVTAGGEVCRLKDGRGIQMLAQLCAQPGRELHVLALMGATGDEAADAGDAGALLDEEAVAEYRERLAELDAELAEADSWADAGRAARARAEREAIAAELARGVGLGGRERRAGSAAERARTNVQRRIRGAIRKIAESLPALGAYLDRAVKTGTFCSYDPF